MHTLYRDFKTQEALDTQYDVERSVPDFGVYARHFTDQSKLARHRLKCELDVRYGPTLAEYVDVFPAPVRPSPVLMFIHGGYWRMLSAKEFSCVALGLVEAGVTVVNVNYALCPVVNIDEIVRQVRAAIAWTWRHAGDFGADRERIYVSGHSAGGHLTAMSMNTDWPGVYGLPDNLVKGGLSVSGVFDLRPIRYTGMQPAIQLDDGLIARNSPQLLTPRRQRSPLLFSVGGDEPAEFQRQTQDYLQHWQFAGNEARFIAQPGKNHFDAIYGFEQSDSPLCQALFTLMGVSTRARHRPPNR
ncbi:MAG: alpha/beta hydrolase [Burkholderiaceae bacterium]